MLTPLRSHTLVDQASEQLLRLIDESELCEGDSLPSIGELAERFGASRAVIRESLKTLEAQGAIDIANGKKAKIKPVTAEPLFNFFQRAMQMDGRVVSEFAN